MSDFLKNHIRSVKDFPKPGIMFRDITTVLKDPHALKYTVRQLLKHLEDVKIDKVACIESRGFILGSILAYELNAGFVPLRKPGKLPAAKYSESYALEYGTDTIEMHTDGIKKGDRVLIHDDLLATGGTAAAAVKLVEQAGGKIEQISFIIELSFLSGRKKLEGYNIVSLVDYIDEN